MSSASPANESQGAITAGLQAHAHACVTCAQRKVKCDRLQPCSNCERAKIDCEYRDPPPPKRRKRKQPLDEETQAKLERYEKLLREFGVEVESPQESIGDGRSPGDHQTDASSRRESAQPAKPVVIEMAFNGKKYAASGRAEYDEKLIIDGHKSRYVENNLWGSLSEDIDHTKEESSAWYDAHHSRNANDFAQQLRERGPATLLFGNNQLLSPEYLLKLHPPLEHMRKLWFTFRENVDPLVKLFDINIKEQMFLKTAPLQADGSWRVAESFFFAVYFCAITSLDDEECMKEFGESRTVLLDRYQMGIEQALINANLLNTSDMFVLQSFILYLLCLRLRADTGTIWILTGVGLRMAQRGGLHRDAEKIDGNIWPWNAELRRRAWWQLMLLDGRISEVSGVGHSTWSSFRWDTKRPLNLNDSDLEHSATEYPTERVGATDMLFCSIGFEMGTAFRSLMLPSGSSTESDISEQETMVDELEKNLEHKYLRYCDPLVPLHQMSSILTRAALVVMRFKLNHPRRRRDKGRSAPQHQKDRAFSLAVKVLEYYNLAHSTKAIKRYMWFVRTNFPWAQSVYLLSELQYRHDGVEVERAWKQLDEIMGHHPEVIQDKTKGIHIAFANFALRMWDSRAKELNQPVPKKPDPSAPAFIQTLQVDAQINKSKQSDSKENSHGEETYDWNPHAPLGNVHTGIGAEPLYSTTPDMSYPSVGYNTDFNIDMANSNWPQWDDPIFQDSTLSLGLPLTLDNRAGSFGAYQ